MEAGVRPEEGSLTMVIGVVGDGVPGSGGEFVMRGRIDRRCHTASAPLVLLVHMLDPGSNTYCEESLPIHRCGDAQPNVIPLSCPLDLGATSAHALICRNEKLDLDYWQRPMFVGFRVASSLSIEGIICTVL